MRLAPVFALVLPFAVSLEAAVPPETGQVVVVITPAWESTSGMMWRMSKEGAGWRVEREPVAVTVGHKGLGLGVGLHPQGLPGPEKSEGDRRAPAGVFLIESAFGTGVEKKAKLSYRRTTKDDLWVDDPASSHYNQWVDAGVRRDWSSAEVLRREDGLYELAIVVGHNRNPVIKGRGSAIFMHRWYGPGRSTIGCTAMDRSDLRALFEWLEARYRPVIIQAPRELLPRLGLPETLLEVLNSLPVR